MQSSQNATNFKANFKANTCLITAIRSRLTYVNLTLCKAYVMVYIVLNPKSCDAWQKPFHVFASTPLHKYLHILVTIAARHTCA